jgi:hypothetical protein
MIRNVSLVNGQTDRLALPYTNLLQVYNLRVGPEEKLFVVQPMRLICTTLDRQVIERLNIKFNYFLVSCQKAEIIFDVLGAQYITFLAGKVLTRNKKTNSGYDYEVEKQNAFKCVTNMQIHEIN